MAPKIIGVPGRALDGLGRQLSFYVQAYGFAYKTIRRYRTEVFRQVAAVSFGTGALAVVGGTAVIVAFLTGTAGIEVSLQGTSQLQNIGVDALSGFLSAYVNTRIAAPLISGVALVATVGAGFTAEIGAMRISEEIDALEVMAVRPIPFLVTTRVIAGFIAITPLYAIALFFSYALSRFATIFIFHQSTGSYDHYFSTFLIPRDIIASYIEVLLMAVLVISVHCYYGYTASGGPAGVGQAVGRAVRLSLVGVMFVALFASLVLYANSDTLHISR
jgi:phospholipid/cholesterol/gamma-HCH transport system permease protein